MNLYLLFVLKIFNYIVFGSFLLIATVWSREVNFKVSVTDSLRDVKAGYTLSIFSENILLVSDDEGLFRSLVTDESAVELPDGTYEYEVIFEDKIQKGQLLVNEETPRTFEISFEREAVEETNLENEGENEGGNLKRLSTVRVKKAARSDKRVIQAEEARRLPGTGGDVLASLRSLPGVVTAGTFSTDLFIRGGGKDDVSYRYKDIVIGSPYHEIFFFSVFPPEILSSILFFPGGHPAEYENVQGSVIDVIGKDFYEYDEPYSVDFNLSFILASLSASIEFLDKFRISFGGRRSYIEGYIALADSIGVLDAFGDLTLIPVFYDAHFVFEWQMTPVEKLEFVFLFSGDEFVFNTKGAEFEGATPDERIFIDSSFQTATLWDSEAIVYSLLRDEHEFEITIYRYAERYNETNQNVESFNLTNEDYTLRGGYNVLLSDVLKLENYFKYSLDRGYGLNRVDPEGRAPPDPLDYLTFNDSTGAPDGVALQNFLNAIDVYNAGLVPVSETFFRNRLAFSSSLITTLRNVVINSGFVLYYDDLSLNQVEGDFRIRTTYTPEVNLGALEIFGYVGRFIQYPTIALRNENTGQLFFQDYALKVPHTYQFGIGAVWDVQGWEFSFEPYYKILNEQVLYNPTYDTAFPKEDGNFPSVNLGGGYAYGTELLLRRSAGRWFTGWFAYTWGRAFVRQFEIPVTEDRGVVSSDPANNGQDYLNYSTVLAPFEQNIEHSIKLVAGFKLGKKVNFSLSTIGNSGKPYTPKVIGTNSTLVENQNCSSAPFCDRGLIFVDDPNRINAERLPWTLRINIRFDFLLYKKKLFEASMFIDVLDLQSVFYENIAGYRYDRGAIRFLSPNSIGQDAPSASISSDADGIVLPVIGYEFRF